MRSGREHKGRKWRIFWVSLIAVLLVAAGSAYAINRAQTTRQADQKALASSSSSSSAKAKAEAESKKAQSASVSSAKAASHSEAASASESKQNTSAFDGLTQRTQLAILTQWAWNGYADPAATFAAAEGQPGGVIYIKITRGGGTTSLGGWINVTRKIVDHGDGTFSLYKPHYDGGLDGSPIAFDAVTWDLEQTINSDQLLADYQTSGTQIATSMDLSQLAVADPTQLK